MSYTIPQQIIMANRKGEIDNNEIIKQLNSLAMILASQQNLDTRISALEASVTTLNLMPLFLYKDRTLNTEFTPHTTRNTLVFYTLELQVSRFVTGNDNISVSIIIDGIQQSTVKNALDVTLSLGLGITNTSQKHLFAFVPVNSVVKLETSGSGSASIIQSVEVLL